MKQLQFKVEIQATKEKVWDTLWQNKTFREWAGIIDPGTYMIGELKAGNKIQFISGNGYGVTSLVEKYVPYEFLMFRHEADTQDSGESTREPEWTGGTESYTLTDEGRGTTLTATFDVPPHMEDYFKVTYPKALKRVKELAEITE